MNRFILERNVISYVERLHMEQDGGTRRTLQQLLIEEEDRFAQGREKVDLLDRMIGSGEARIAKLTSLPPVRHDGAASSGDRLLQCLNDTVALLKTIRTRVTAQLEENTFSSFRPSPPTE